MVPAPRYPVGKLALKYLVAVACGSILLAFAPAASPAASSDEEILACRVWARDISIAAPLAAMSMSGDMATSANTLPCSHVWNCFRSVAYLRVLKFLNIRLLLKYTLTV